MGCTKAGLAYPKIIGEVVLLFAILFVIVSFLYILFWRVVRFRRIKHRKRQAEDKEKRQLMQTERNVEESMHIRPNEELEQAIHFQVASDNDYQLRFLLCCCTDLRTHSMLFVFSLGIMSMGILIYPINQSIPYFNPFRAKISLAIISFLGVLACCISVCGICCLNGKGVEGNILTFIVEAVRDVTARGVSR